MPAGCALAALADHTATYWNMPERREIDTRIIMPVSSPMVFQSTPFSASSWFITPTMTITAAPSSATMERLILLRDDDGVGDRQHAGGDPHRVQAEIDV